MIELLLEPLRYEFVVRALVVTVVAAVACALLSCWLVWLGWSLMGDAVSHAVLPGVVLAYLLGWPFAVGAVVFGLLAVALIGAVRSGGPVKEDAAIGIVFTTLFASGLVLVSVVPSHVDLGHIVFGNVLGVAPGDLVQVGVLGAVVVVTLLVLRRRLVVFAFDPVHAHAVGLRPRLLGAVLLGLLAVTCVVALQVVGVVLVVGMLILPGATAQLLTERFGRMLALAPLISAGCAVTGILAAYHLDASPGALVVVLQGLVFALAHLLAPRHGLVARARLRRGSGRRRPRTGAVPPEPAPSRPPAGGSPGSPPASASSPAFR